jgi:probable phosphoglycerate mutase
VRRLICARHGESEFNVKGLINSNPTIRNSPLTETGREQARLLGLRLADEPIDLCVTSEIQRAVETAEIALESRGITWLELALLNDPPAGVFEGRPVEEFARWMRENGPDVPVPGTAMSLRDSTRRFHEAARFLLARPEPVVLAMAHGPAIRWLLQAASGGSTRLDYLNPLIQYAEPIEIEVDALRSSLPRLEADPYSVFGRG